MKSLKESITNQLEESIVSSNGVGIISRLKDILLSKPDYLDATVLNRIWRSLKLDLPRYMWEVSSTCYKFAGWNDGLGIMRNSDDGGLLLMVHDRTYDFDEKQSKEYCNLLIKTLNMTLDEKIKFNSDYYYHLKFK